MGQFIRIERLLLAALCSTALSTGWARCSGEDIQTVLALRAQDQAVREDGVYAAMDERRYLNVLEALSKADRAALVPVLRRCGWTFGDEAFGEASQAAWYLVQHVDDTAFQRQQLGKLKSLSARVPGVPRKELAYLEDRVLLGEGKAQRYGSQLQVVDGKLLPLPIQNADLVDERRASMGLPPMQEYLAEAQRKFRAMSGQP